MKAASVADLKKELVTLPNAQLVELCLKLAKFKKENKEVLSFLLYDAHDVPTYIENCKLAMENEFENVQLNSTYFAKKTIRKILKLNQKYVKCSGSTLVDIELLIHFCSNFKKLGTKINGDYVLGNIYDNQTKKIKKLIATLHEDLQYDYLQKVKQL